MALTEKSRSALYQGLTEVVDEEAVQEMLSFFPARDVEEPVTKEFLRAEMAELRAELSTEMVEFKTEIRAEMVELERRLSDRIARAQAWNILAMVAIASVIIAAVRL